MTYGKNYCEEKGISTSGLNDAQKTLFYMAENMKMDKSISEEGYEHFQMAIKALEQEPCEDVMAIHTQGLDEGIRCAMCTNSMKSDRGCDGGCVVNEAMYKEVMNTIRNHIVPPVTPKGVIITDFGCLDKIKSEIEQDAFKDVNGSKYIFVNRVNQIIDKYKVENE